MFPSKTNMASLRITCFCRKYNFIHSGFSSVTLVFGGGSSVKLPSHEKNLSFHNNFPLKKKELLPDSRQKSSSSARDPVNWLLIWRELFQYFVGPGPTFSNHRGVWMPKSHKVGTVHLDIQLWRLAPKMRFVGFWRRKFSSWPATKPLEKSEGGTKIPLGRDQTGCMALHGCILRDENGYMDTWRNPKWWLWKRWTHF